MSRTPQRRRTLATLAPLAFAAAAGAAAPAHATYQDARDILEGGTLGGTRGLRVRRIGAPAAYSLNSGFVFYPASSLKVLEHLYAMRRVQGGSWSLDGTNASVCAGGDDNCGPLLNSMAACGAAPRTLRNTLSAMMRQSSNEATNAVQELAGTSTYPFVPPFSGNMAAYGRGVINSFAQNTVGLTNTAVNHKFGCAGFCGNPNPNTMTLVDAERLYAAIGTDASVLAPAMRQPLHDLMLNESNSFLNGVIDQEAASTGKNAYKEAFRDRVYMIFKDGSWTCSGKKYLSHAGLLQLPTQNGAGQQLYTWGAFAHDTEAEFYIDGTLGASLKELLRPAVRAALLTWGPGYASAAAGGAGERMAALSAGYSSAAAPVLGEASALLGAARGELARPRRDYGRAVALLRDAAVQLERARRVDPGLGADEALMALVQLGREASLDVHALVTATAGAPAAEVLAGMERQLREADSLRRRGAHGAALRELAAAAAQGAPLIDWAQRDSGAAAR